MSKTNPTQKRVRLDITAETATSAASLKAGAFGDMNDLEDLLRRFRDAQDRAFPVPVPGEPIF